LFREAVRSVLEAEPDVAVVADAGDGLSAMMEVGRTRPDCVLLDSALGTVDGIKATRMIKDRLPDCAVIVLAADEDPEVLLASIEAGATGFLTKGVPIDELIDAVRAACRGETMIPPRMLSDLLHRLLYRRKEQEEALRRTSRLTRREREVLALLAEGAGNESIAEALVISPQTARTHIQNVLGKLGVHSRLEAAMFVAQNGIERELVPVDG
jgi:DNA-binding NarL/FixJ family response regulator